MTMKICTIIGARPQFIKAAAISRAIAAHNRLTLNLEPSTSNIELRTLNIEHSSSVEPGTLNIEHSILNEVLIHTGQHYDDGMSAVFFRELEIPEPKYNLAIGSGSHGAQTGQMLAAIEKVLLEEKPDWVLIYGDTNSTLAGALAASKLHIPIAHVEAGLRSFNRRMPEEINRVVADQLSTLLLCPSQIAVNNLAAEGIGGKGDRMSKVIDEPPPALRATSASGGQKESSPPMEKDTCPPLEGVGGGSPLASRNGWEPFPTTPNIEQSSNIEHRTLNVEQSSPVEHRTLNLEQSSPPLEKETCPPLEGVGGGSPLASRNGWEPFPTTPNLEQSSPVEHRTLNIEHRTSNLEPLTPPHVIITGDVMADALQFAATKASAQSDILMRLGLQPQRYILATVHRAENTDDPKRLSNIMAALAELAEREPVILPLHPRTRKILERTSNLEHRTLNIEQSSPPLEKDTCPPLEGVGGGSPLASRNGWEPFPTTPNLEQSSNIEHRTLNLEQSSPVEPRTLNLEPRTSNLEHPSLRIIDPLGYFDIIALEKSARMLLTDSGGMQKEAYWLKVPCITLRDETEWVETVESGWNILTGADRDRIVTAVHSFKPPSVHPPLYGDGHAAEKILSGLCQNL